MTVARPLGMHVSFETVTLPPVKGDGVCGHSGRCSNMVPFLPERVEGFPQPGGVHISENYRADLRAEIRVSVAPPG